MTWPYHYSPHIWPSLFTVFLLIVLSVYSWRHRSVPGTLAFAIASLFGALLVAGSAMEHAAVDEAAKTFWFLFKVPWLLPAITVMTCFLLEYASPGRWLTRRNIALLSVVPVSSGLLLITNNIHHMLWQSLVFDQSVTSQYGPASWAIFAYALGLSTVDLIVLVWLFVRSPQHRWPVVIMLTGQVAAQTGFILDVTGTPNSGFPLDILSIAFVFLTYAIVLFGFRIFDPMPLARRQAIEHLYAGMLVLDARGLIVSLNRAAEGILHVPEKLARGLPVWALLPAYPEGHADDTSETEIELALRPGQEARNYALAISPLRDWRGVELGRLMLLRDVTERKKARAQLLEQARALAVLQERDHVARELHDDLGQVLGYVKMQAQTAREHLALNQTHAADNDLAQLTAVVQEVHVDVREYILGARSGISAGLDLPAALRQYLQMFENSYGIHTDLIWPPGLSQGSFEPTVEVQLLRIVQEALTNARKHAHASSVCVSICSQDGQARVAVEDDGVGFDPGTLATGENQKYGLRFMRERVEEVGGSLEIQSAPGAGTRAIIFVPLSSHRGPHP